MFSNVDHENIANYSSYHYFFVFQKLFLKDSIFLAADATKLVANYSHNNVHIMHSTVGILYNTLYYASQSKYMQLNK